MICFVVLAHKNPGQVARLVDLVAPHQALVHVDARAPQEVWHGFEAMAAQRGHVELLERRRSGWASWGVVGAAVSGLRRAATTGCSHVVVLSGQDYLLRPVSEIASALGSQPGASWLSNEKIPATYIGDPDGGLSRLTHRNWAVKGRRVALALPRRLPDGIAPYYGQGQSVVSMPLVRWLIEELDRRPGLVKFFRRSWAPDELFLPSMAMASPLASQVQDANLWYVDWSAGGSHPRTFTEADLGTLVAAAEGNLPGMSGGQLKFFARKFDTAYDERVLDLLDERLLLGATTARRS